MPGIPELRADKLLPDFRFNPRLRGGAGAYVDARGRMVSQATIKGQLEKVLGGLRMEARATGGALRTGNIGLNAWHAQMQVIIKRAHLTGAAAQKGGWAHLNQSDFGRVGAAVRKEYDYLINAAMDVMAGYQKMDGTLDRRSMMYAEAARGTYYEFAQRGAAQAGYTEEMSVQYPGDSCRGCIGEARRGWVPLGSLIPVGQRDCYSGCRCSIRYRRPDGEEIDG